MGGYRFFNTETLAETLRHVGKCATCGSTLTLREDTSMRRGLVSRMSIQCENPARNMISYLNNPYSEEARVVNTLSVLGMRMVGRGRSGLETFCAFMNTLSPVSPPCYSEHNQRILEASIAEAAASQEAAASCLHELQGRSENDAIDVAVTCDGTWSKRGFTALYSVVVVASWENGKVLDTEILTKYCAECGHHVSMSKESEEYKQWWEGHKDDCELNYHGSSPAMEATGALRIWQQSAEKHNLRYTVVISDGDSKTLKDLNDNSPYGEIEIIKHECVGHVQKRLGTQLRTLKKSGKKDKNGKAVRFGGRGRLTDKSIDALQVFYGGAIRNHKNDLQGMEQAIWAVYHHSVSTDLEPQHEYCPTGDQPWCKYQRAISLSEQPPHHTPKIPVDLAEYVKPIFTHLSHRTLLEKCLLGATQNQNESFNNLVWCRCPKTEFSSPTTVQIAVNLAILTFNDGMMAMESLLDRLGAKCAAATSAFLMSRDRCLSRLPEW